MKGRLMKPRTVTGGLRAQAWWLLRKNKAMTIADILLTICDGSEKFAGANLTKWLNALAKAGIFRRDLTAKSGRWVPNGRYRYVLVRDLGPKAPVVRVSEGVVFDPNSGSVLEIPSSATFSTGGDNDAAGGEA